MCCCELEDKAPSSLVDVLRGEVEEEFSLDDAGIVDNYGRLADLLSAQHRIKKLTSLRILTAVVANSAASVTSQVYV